MKALLLIAVITLSTCDIRGTWKYHFGPHRLELVDSFYLDGKKYEVYGCYKMDCPYREVFPNPKYHR